MSRSRRWADDGNGHDDSEDHTLLAECVAETPYAWCVRVVRLGEARESDLWLPKSMCSREGSNTWSMPTWIAHKEKLI